MEHLKVDILYNGEEWKILGYITCDEMGCFSSLEFAERYCKEKKWIIMATYS